MDKEIKLILTKLKLVSEIEESGAYICDKEHSKLLLDYITNLQEEKERLLGCLNDLHSLYHYKFYKILEQIKVIIDKIKNIIQGSDKE